MSLAEQSLQWYPTSVQVTVLQARGLRIKGKNGTNDAYAIMQVAKEKFNTSVSEKCVAPVWKEEATFDLPLFHSNNAERCNLQVCVMHRAVMGPDKTLGQANINLLDLNDNKSRNKTEWFKLVSKSGKADKDRGEVLLDIQFMKNNMTASMFDLSGPDKSRSKFGKLKDKLKGKKKDGMSDSASAIVPSVSQILTDSEEEEETHVTPGAKKKNKLKSLFVPKSGLHRNMSQSMSTLATLPEKDSAISLSRSSGLNVESPEGKKKFKFLKHKRTGSSDSKVSQGASSLGQGTVQNSMCINGSHVYTEEPETKASRASSPFSLNSSGHGSMEDIRRGHSRKTSNTSVDSLKTSDLQTQENAAEDMRRKQEEQRKQEEEVRKRLEEEKRRQAEEEKREQLRREAVRKEEERKWIEREEERKRIEKEEERKLVEIEELKRKKEEDERKRIEREEERKRIEKEEERKLVEIEEGKRKKEEDEKKRIEREKERKRIEKEEERKLIEREEERMRKEEERKRVEREMEERQRVEEEERERFEKAEMVRIKKEQERVRQEEERKQAEEESIRVEERMREMEKRKKMEEEEKLRRMEEEERARLEKERQRKEEETQRIEMQRRHTEEEEILRKEKEAEELLKRKVEDEKERQRKEEETQRIEMQRRHTEEEERLRKEMEAEELQKRKVEDEKKTEEKESLSLKERLEKERLEIEKKKMEERMREEQERKRAEEEEKRKLKEKATEQERIRQEEEKEKQGKMKEQTNTTEMKPEVKPRSARLNTVMKAEKHDVIGSEYVPSANPFEEGLSFDENSSNPFEVPQPEALSCSAKVSAVKPSSSVSGRFFSQALVPNTNPFLDDSDANSGNTEIIVSLGDGAEQSENKRRAPMPPQNKTRIGKPDVSSRDLSSASITGATQTFSSRASEDSEDSDLSCLRRDKRPAPLPPDVSKNKQEVLNSEHADPSTNYLHTGEWRTPSFQDKGQSGKDETRSSMTDISSSTRLPHLSQSQPSIEAETNPFISVGLRTAKHNKGPAPAKPSAKSIESSASEPEPNNLAIDNLNLNENTKVKSAGKLDNLSVADVPSRKPEPVHSNYTDSLSLRESGQEEMPAKYKQDSHREDVCSSLDSVLNVENVPLESDAMTGVSKKKSQAPLPPVKLATIGEPNSTRQPPAGVLFGQPNRQDEDKTLTINSDVLTSSFSPFLINSSSTPSQALGTVHEKNEYGPVRLETGYLSGHKFLPQARVSPIDAQPVVGQSNGSERERTEDPASKSCRPHAVKPLSTTEKPPYLIETQDNSRSTKMIDGVQAKMKAPEAKGTGRYSQLTHEELVNLLEKQKEQLSQKDSKIVELEQYIDKLLVRVMEEQPSILMSLSSLKKSV